MVIRPVPLGGLNGPARLIPFTLLETDRKGSKAHLRMQRRMRGNQRRAHAAAAKGAERNFTNQLRSNRILELIGKLPLDFAITETIHLRARGRPVTAHSETSMRPHGNARGGKARDSAEERARTCRIAENDI